MTYKTRHERRARGGKAVTSEPIGEEHGHLYNAHGSPAAEAIDAKSDGFKRGGKAKKHHRKEGGHVEGHGAKHHMGKRARGGRTEHHKEHESKHEEKLEEERKEHKREEHDREERAAGGPVMRAAGGPVMRARGGGAPFSSAHKLSGPTSTKGDGPGEQAKTIP